MSSNVHEIRQLQRVNDEVHVTELWVAVHHNALYSMYMCSKYMYLYMVIYMYIFILAATEG